MAWNIESSRQFAPDLEILVHQVNVDVAASIVIDASTVAPDPATGDRVIVAGTPMRKNANNQYQEWVTADGTTNPIAGILARTERLPDGTNKSDLPSAIWNHGQWFRADRIKGWAANSAAIRAALPTCKFS